ncbi:hypothetical protein L9F63_003139 [Diploptera punctata]|uniref:Uncharacterized protein n=1 Tax=Diploptera punctata TaxID=6984 RepID=A0AAD7ZLD8_DIPPU|nr:hypothetical protein L9F63_003139 [Diploptera punctata]
MLFTNLLIVKTGANSQCLYNCVTSIIDHTFEYSRTITVVTSGEIHGPQDLLEVLHRREQWTLILLSYPQTHTTKLFFTNDDFSNYLIILNVGKTINELILELRKNIEYIQILSPWKQESKFIVLMKYSINIKNSKKHIEIILNELWKSKIIQVLVLHQMTENVVDMFSWYPYRSPSGVCGKLQEIVLLDYFSCNTEEHLLQNNILFSQKIPSSIKDCPLRVSTAHFPPYAIFNFHKTSGTLSMTGLDVKLAQVIAETMHMFLELKPLYDTYPWGKIENGTWGGLRGRLIYDEDDIVVAGWSNNLKDHLLLQDTERYYTDRIAWYVPRAQSNPRWLSLIRVFTLSTWITFSISIFLSAIVSWLLVYPTINYRDYIQFNNQLVCILNSWSVVLGISIPELPHGNSLRLYFIAWVIYSFSVNTVFQAFFTSYLIDPGFEHQISNMEEIVQSNLKIVLSVFLAYFFDEKLLTDPNRRIVVDTPKECIDLATNMGKAATMLSRTFVWSEIFMENTTFDFADFREDVINNHIVMIVQKGVHF